MFSGLFILIYGHSVDFIAPEIVSVWYKACMYGKHSGHFPMEG